MEKLFIRILNRALLAICGLLLAGAIVIALVAAVKFVGARDPAVDRGDIVVSYTPLPPLPPSALQHEASGDPKGRLSADDVNLMNAATSGCQAVGRLAAVLTDKRLDMHGSGLTTCETAQLKTAQGFGNRATNYLSAFSSYFTSLANDPHLLANYPSLTDDQARDIVAGFSGDFAAKFRAQIEAQDARNLAAQMDASAQRLMSITYLGVAGSAFVAFLFIAFLIVFLRMEKHLETISVQPGANASAKNDMFATSRSAA